jgi:outer membrane immunogenic protein
MQKFAVAIAAMATLTGASAFAADMAVKVPPLPPLAAPNWTGFYIGGALGGKWANTTWTTTSTSDLPGTIVDVSSPRNFDPSGFRAGGYAGYNWQIAPWVVGLEGDLAWSNNTATVAGIPGCTIQCFPGAPGPGVNTSSVKVEWDASLRARLGHMITPDLLIYGTGGVAWQEIVSSGTCQHSLPNPQCTVAAGNPFDTQTNRNIFTGWTVGGGIEKMYGNWMLRAEYRFSQFGNANDVLPFSAPGIAVGTDFSRYKLSVQTHIATVGLAYKFGSP